MNVKNLSVSEDNGISQISEGDLNIYSVGISTGGKAELRMAALKEERNITATTIDREGIEHSKKLILEAGFANQITIKYEDVSEPLPYEDGFFDFVYARLVLHYLTKNQLKSTLNELNRVLKSGGKLFVVVRSVDCPDAKSEGATYDEKTGLTKYVNPWKASPHKFVSRYFHTEQSISDAISESQFEVLYVKSYEEQLFADFAREAVAPHSDYVIELLGQKL